MAVTTQMTAISVGLVPVTTRQQYPQQQDNVRIKGSIRGGQGGIGRGRLRHQRMDQVGQYCQRYGHFIRDFRTKRWDEQNGRAEVYNQPGTSIVQPQPNLQIIYVPQTPSQNMQPPVMLQAQQVPP